MNVQTFLGQRINSVGFALQGLLNFFKQEANAWVHLIATVIVVIAAYCFHVSNVQAISLVIVTGMVWIAEAFNTVIERAMDLVCPQKNPKVAFIKDLSAGAVLLAALTAFITGCIIFIPKIV